MRHTRYGFWLEEAGPVEPTRPLDGDTSADVVVVGAGFLGLWTAWQLKALEPGLDVVVLEAGLAGHGPSGRNGGFVSTLWDDLPILRDRVGDDASRRGVSRVRTRRARNRGVVRERRRRRLVQGGRHAPGRDERRPGRRLGRRRRGVPRRRSARGGGGPLRRGRGGPVRVSRLSRRHAPARSLRTCSPRGSRSALRAKAIDAGVRLYERTPVRRLGRDATRSRRAVPRFVPARRCSPSTAPPVASRGSATRLPSRRATW